MSVDLSKCKIGDKVQLRNGKVANIVFVDKRYIAHNGREKEKWLCNIHDGESSFGSDPKFSIVKVLTRHNDRKVAKCIVWEDCQRWGWHCYSLRASSSEAYTTRKNAIRGARRFCKRIGYECEIVK